MNSGRMKKLAGINEGTIFKNGKFELPRWDTDYDGEPFYEMPKYGEWCKYEDVAKLEEIARQMYDILNDLVEADEDDYYSDYRMVADAARKVLAKIPK